MLITQETLPKLLSIQPQLIQTAVAIVKPKIHVVHPHQRFRDAIDCPETRGLDSKDKGTIGGCFIPAANVVLVRSHLTAAPFAKPEAILKHELGHLLDFIAGGCDVTSLWSMHDEKINDIYARVVRTGMAISRYALVAPWELNAEALRAFYGGQIQGDRDERARLHSIDPELYECIEGFLDLVETKAAALSAA